jgi:hypothetical protein
MYHLPFNPPTHPPAPTHSPILQLTHPPIHLPTHPPTHPPTYTLTHTHTPAHLPYPLLEHEPIYLARYPRPSPDFTGKRVGVIGTGSSAIQAIPVIAEQAASLTVFQRTPQYTIPANNHPLDSEYVRRARENYSRIRDAEKRSFAGRTRCDHHCLPICLLQMRTLL